MKKSAGILAYRFIDRLELFLVHPGGPFFKNKDAGSWTIPKGEILPGENELLAAQREFYEETSHVLEGEFFALTPIKQKGGKLVIAWAIEQDIDAEKIVSNIFEIEWPPQSGLKKEFPEIDKAAWFTIEEAAIKINPAQLALVNELEKMLTRKIA